MTTAVCDGGAGGGAAAVSAICCSPVDDGRGVGNAVSEAAGMDAVVLVIAAFAGKSADDDDMLLCCTMGKPYFLIKFRIVIDCVDPIIIFIS